LRARTGPCRPSLIGKKDLLCRLIRQNGAARTTHNEHVRGSSHSHIYPPDSTARTNALPQQQRLRTRRHRGKRTSRRSIGGVRAPPTRSQRSTCIGSGIISGCVRLAGLTLYSVPTNASAPPSNLRSPGFPDWNPLLAPTAGAPRATSEPETRSSLLDDPPANPARCNLTVRRPCHAPRKLASFSPASPLRNAWRARAHLLAGVKLSGHSALPPAGDQTFAAKSRPQSRTPISNGKPVPPSGARRVILCHYHFAPAAIAGASGRRGDRRSKHDDGLAAGAARGHGSLRSRHCDLGADSTTPNARRPARSADSAARRRLLDVARRAGFLSAFIFRGGGAVPERKKQQPHVQQRRSATQ